MRKMTHPFFHDASILVSVGVFLTHRFETVGVFAHFLCVKNAKTPSIWSSVDTRSGHILSFLLPLIQEGQLSVTGENMCTKYWLTA